MKVFHAHQLDRVDSRLVFTMSKYMELFGGLFKGTVHTFEIPQTRNRCTVNDDRAYMREEHTVVDHVYLKSAGRRQVLLVHWGYIIAFVCLPAALVQAFGDHGPIIQVCLYWLLAFVILYAMFCAASYGIDVLFIRRAQAIIKNLEQEPFYNNYVEDHFLWCVDSTDNLPFTDSQMRQNRINEQFTKRLWRWLDFALFTWFVIISTCTVVYVYDNLNRH